MFLKGQHQQHSMIFIWFSPWRSTDWSAQLVSSTASAEKVNFWNWNIPQNMFHAREPIMFLTYCSSHGQHNIIDARSGLVVILTSTITVRLPQGDERWLACNQLSWFVHSNLNLAFRRTDEKAHFLWSEAFKVSFGFSLLTFLWRRWRFQFSSDDVHWWRKKRIIQLWGRGENCNLKFAFNTSAVKLTQLDQIEANWFIYSFF